MSEPQVTVLMPTYNRAAFLESSMRSLMNQTLRDIVIMVVDDGSQDETPNVMARLMSEDPRIVYERLEKNIGGAAASNHGLDMINTTYVARMDDDDISLPRRLEVQKAYMDRHPNVMLTGTGVEFIDENDTVLRRSFRPRDAAAMRWLARFQYPTNHPTTMFRRVSTSGQMPRYDGSLSCAIDYDFFATALNMGEAVSLPEVVFRYREHSASITGTKYKEQHQNAAKIARGIQAADLPAHVCDALEPFNVGYLDHQPQDPALMFEGFRQMIAHDVTSRPDRRAWMLRHGAQLIQLGLKRTGLSNRETVAAFARHGRDFFVPLGMRVLESKQLLPSVLRRDARPT